jgi:hypothetical protein
MPTTKLPSEWLGSLKHDYFGNVIPLIKRRTPELNRLLKGNDFWHDTVRNVLRFPFENSPARTFGMEEGDRASDIELIRRIASTPCELVVPPWLEPSLIEAGWKRGAEYSVYANKDEAEAILGGPAERGQKRILVQDLEIVPVDEASKSFPRVIAGDHEFRMSWRGWNAALATNILGAFSRSDFETTPSHGCLASGESELLEGALFRSTSGIDWAHPRADVRGPTNGWRRKAKAQPTMPCAARSSSVSRRCGTRADSRSAIPQHTCENEPGETLT